MTLTRAADELARRRAEPPSSRREGGGKIASLAPAGSGSGRRTTTPAARLERMALGLVWLALVVGAVAWQAGQALGAPTVAAQANEEASRRQMERSNSELLALAEEEMLLAKAELPGGAEPTLGRRLSKRSGISDQRLAEIQMIRALRKQLERASKLAAGSAQLIQEPSVEEAAARSNTS